MTRLLANLEGKGYLTIGTVSGMVDYDIAVMAGDNFKSASGVIEAGIELLMSGFEAGSATLRLRDGRVINVILTGVDAGAGSATIEVNGPVPGY